MKKRWILSLSICAAIPLCTVWSLMHANDNNSMPKILTYGCDNGNSYACTIRSLQMAVIAHQTPAAITAPPWQADPTTSHANPASSNNSNIPRVGQYTQFLIIVTEPQNPDSSEWAAIKTVQAAFAAQFVPDEYIQIIDASSMTAADLQTFFTINANILASPQLRYLWFATTHGFYIQGGDNISPNPGTRLSWDCDSAGGNCNQIIASAQGEWLSSVDLGHVKLAIFPECYTHRVIDDADGTHQDGSLTSWLHAGNPNTIVLGNTFPSNFTNAELTACVWTAIASNGNASQDAGLLNGIINKCRSNLPETQTLGTFYFTGGAPGKDSTTLPLGTVEHIRITNYSNGPNVTLIYGDKSLTLEATPDLGTTYAENKLDSILPPNVTIENLIASNQLSNFSFSANGGTPVACTPLDSTSAGAVRFDSQFNDLDFVVNSGIAQGSKPFCTITYNYRTV